MDSNVIMMTLLPWGAMPGRLMWELASKNWSPRAGSPPVIAVIQKEVQKQTGVSRSVDSMRQKWIRLWKAYKEARLVVDRSGEAALETKPPYYDVFDEHFCTNKKVCADGVIDSGAGAKPAGVTSAGEAEAAAAERRKKRLSASERQAALDEAKVAAFQQLGEGLRVTVVRCSDGV